MKHVDLHVRPLFCRIWCIVGLLGVTTHLHAAHIDSFLVTSLEITPVQCEKGNCEEGTKLVRIAGRLLEKSSHRPLDRAAVMISCGKLALASKRADEKGEFLFYIPLEKVSEQTIDLRIQYLDHVFVKEGLQPIDQEILIEINEAIMSERQTFDDYKVPTHMLGIPTVGNVYIRS